MAAPASAKPPIIIAQVAGSGHGARRDVETDAVQQQTDIVRAVGADDRTGEPALPAVKNSERVVMGASPSSEVLVFTPVVLIRPGKTKTSSRRRCSRSRSCRQTSRS